MIIFLEFCLVSKLYNYYKIINNGSENEREEEAE